MITEETRAWLAGITKTELHRHLEGSVRPATLAEICLERGIPLPTYDSGELARMLRLSAPVADLGEFFTPFRTIKFCFADREAFARLAYEAVEDADAETIRYLELRFSPEFMAFYHRLPLSDVLDGVADGIDLASRRFPVRTRMVVSVSRDLSSEKMGMPWPTPVEIARLAVRYADRGVVGLDLSGRELGYPPSLFVEAFRMAREAGLGITVHAGEDDGPESVREAIELLGATRIGHGVRVVRDPEVLRTAIDRGVAFEVCPTSNVLTHAVDSMERHPVRALYDSGARVTIGADDPTVCGVTLVDEYALLMDRFGFTEEEIGVLLANARAAAFDDAAS